MSCRGLVVVAVALLIATPAAALCPQVAIEPIPEGNSVLVTMGPFTTEDGVTPVTPPTLTVRIDGRASGGIQPTPAPFWPPATVVPTSPTVQVVIPDSAFIVRDRRKAQEDHVINFVWTWGTGHRGECSYVFPVQRRQAGP